MPVNPARQLVCVALTVTVRVDPHDPELLERLNEDGRQASIADIVSWEIRSNLESVSYVSAVVISSRKEVKP
jgi:hypothetical protein